MTMILPEKRVTAVPDSGCNCRSRLCIAMVIQSLLAQYFLAACLDFLAGWFDLLAACIDFVAACIDFLAPSSVDDRRCASDARSRAIRGALAGDDPGACPWPASS